MKLVWLFHTPTNGTLRMVSGYLVLNLSAVDWSLFHLLSVSSIHDVNHSLGVAVPKVGVVRWAVVYHRLVDRVRRLVREDASGETRHNLKVEVVAEDWPGVRHWLESAGKRFRFLRLPQDAYEKQRRVLNVQYFGSQLQQIKSDNFIIMPYCERQN